jgi:hypothetical protein
VQEAYAIMRWEEHEMKANRTVLTVLVAGLIALEMTLAAVAVSRPEVDAKSSDWTGSWNTEVTIASLRRSYPALVTFTSDGSVIADDASSPVEATGHGSWIKTGPNAGAFTYVFLIGSTEPGQWIKGKVSGALKYNARTDKWSGQFKVALVDQDGQVVHSDSGTMRGTRITVEP